MVSPLRCANEGLNGSLHVEDLLTQKDVDEQNAGKSTA